MPWLVAKGQFSARRQVPWQKPSHSSSGAAAPALIYGLKSVDVLRFWHGAGGKPKNYLIFI
jgi:hypothetical protein